ncbi:MAG: group II intron reverse transcriptase/maturase [Thermodesulfobacteriota bacterium]|nr:group II intron reverse transcriptase/maturase [Thermodesulfobacteriota bacterium]
MRFTSLAHLLNRGFLRDCYYSLDRNKAVGIDEVTWREYGINLEKNLTDLVGRLKRKSYKPLPARRVYIPKDETSKRPLGISAIENKIVEKGITRILESIFEEDFLQCSYGFRKNLNCHQALKELDNLIMTCPVNHIVEADIKGFFDNVKHNLILAALKQRIADSSLLFLIERFLKAGYVEDGMLKKSDKGTPQGSVLSPMLANIFMHYVLDVWFENTVKPHVRGFCSLVRYADDFVIVVQYKNDAEKIERALENRFRKYRLELHPDKSGRKSFGRYERENADKQNRRPNTFDFLGFTHYCDKTRKGCFKLGRKTQSKKLKSKIKDLQEWLKNVRNKVKAKDWWKILGAKLRGHYQYYGISGNMPMLNYFHKIAMRLTYKWINRRSQKQSMYWKEFIEYLDKYPLPTPRIYHNLYTLT